MACTAGGCCGSSGRRIFSCDVIQCNTYIDIHPGRSTMFLHGRKSRETNIHSRKEANEKEAAQSTKRFKYTTSINKQREQSSDLI